MKILPTIIIISVIIALVGTYFAVTEMSKTEVLNGGNLVEILENSSKSDRAIQITDYVIGQYDIDGQVSFDRLLLQDKGEYLYGFVIDAKGIIIGHPNSEHRGDVASIVIDDILTKDDILEMLESDGSTKWIDYQWENQLTGKMDNKTSFVKSHSGLIFGSGYYN